MNGTDDSLVRRLTVPRKRSADLTRRGEVACHGNSEPADADQFVGDNIKRLMAQAGITYEDLVEVTDLDARTIRGIIRGERTPHARTLHRLASGLGVPTDALFARPDGLGPDAFDAATNPVVDKVISSHPDLFRNWSPSNFSELVGQYGVGGELTESGVLTAAHSINKKRETLHRARVVLETQHSRLLSDFIDLLYGYASLTE